ncbi:MAG: BT_3928 family protein [Chitinophagales bacterium]
MNVFSLTGLIALIGVGVMIVSYFIQKPQNWLGAYVRYFLGAYLVFSGVVKAIDPFGTAIKMGEYFVIFTEYSPSFLENFWLFWAELAFPISVFMIVLEIALGISVILGTFKWPTLWIYTGLIIFFTFLTGFSSTTGKVTDCGCFGDFVKLAPHESFFKDIFLIVVLGLLFFFHKSIVPWFKNSINIGLLGLLTVGSLWFSMSNYWDLPVVDFRAYHVGTNIDEGTKDGKDGKYETMYTLVNQAGETKVVESKAYVDDGWWQKKEWTLDKEKTTSKEIIPAKLPTIKDFIIITEDGEEIQDSILNISGFQFFVAAYSVEKSDKSDFPQINKILKGAKALGIPITGLTASPVKEANKYTDGVYKFNNLDAVPIKTMIRGNPGVVLIKDDIIIDKWHADHIDSWEVMKATHNIK